MKFQTFYHPSFHQRRDIDKFGVFFVVPHQEFPARGDVPEGPIINVPTILKHCHILLLFVASALYKPHPTRHVFFTSINEMTELSVFVNLTQQRKKKEHARYGYVLLCRLQFSGSLLQAGAQKSYSFGLEQGIIQRKSGQCLNNLVWNKVLYPGFYNRNRVSQMT